MSEHGLVFGLGSWQIGLWCWPYSQHVWHYWRIPDELYVLEAGHCRVAVWRNADWLLARIRREREGGEE